MTDSFAIAGARIFDGQAWHNRCAVIVRDGVVERIEAGGEVPAGMTVIELDGGMIAPGFVDLQVNGGGGVMLNDAPSVEAIRTICAAHARFGTTALLPTLITDTPELTAAAVAAGADAAREKVPGFLGLHLEGPHLSHSRKGAHDPALIRPMTDADEAALIAARGKMPVLLTTIAPESVDQTRVSRLKQADVVVSLGHTDSDYQTAQSFAQAGATMVTHLFNAMSQIGNREPGVVGAAVDSHMLYAGLIADGIHVHPAAMKIALKAKKGDGKIFLVTDAMATIGTDMKSFTLNGRLIKRENGSLRLEDGTLAGADLDMISAVRFMHKIIGLELEEALKMASLYPAEVVGQDGRLGRLITGSAANIVHLSNDLDVRGVWIEGERAFSS